MAFFLMLTSANIKIFASNNTDEIETNMQEDIFSGHACAHDYSFDRNVSIISAPTFTEKGLLVRYCSKCGSGEYHDLYPLGDAKLKPGKYMIQSKCDTNNYVSVTPGQEYQGGNIAIYGKGKADQIFHVSPNGDSTYGFSYANSSNEVFMIDVAGGNFAGNVWLYPQNNMSPQAWYVVPDGEGWNTIVSKATYYVFDDVNFGTADGTNIGSYYCFPDDAQKYKFILLECDEHNWSPVELVKAPTDSEEGEMVYMCLDCCKTKSVKIPPKSKTITPNISLSKTSFIYNGKVQKPTVTVKDGKKVLKAGNDYIVSFSKTSKNVGKYSVKVTLKGNYKGSGTASYDIIPKGTKITKLTKKGNVYTFKWKKQSKQVSGYEFQYSTSKSFNKGKSTKIVRISKSSITKKKVKKLKSGNKYYIRIRTYKKIKGKKYYSLWSSIKSFKAQ